MSDQPGEIGGARRRRLAAEDAAQMVAVAPGVSADSPATDAVGQAPPKRKRNRKPFGNFEQKLNYPNREGYHRHWFNDEPGRLLRAADAGYEQVVDPDGKPVSMVVGVSRGGGALTAYLHEIPEEWYREDMDDRDSEVLDRLGQIERGQYLRPKGRDGDLQYAGSNTMGNISIQSGTRR